MTFKLYVFYWEFLAFCRGRAKHLAKDEEPEREAAGGILHDPWWYVCCEWVWINSAEVVLILEAMLRILTFSFPGYLKLWQLQTPKPQLHDKYDVLFIDEAQDCTPGNDAGLRKGMIMLFFFFFFLLVMVMVSSRLPSQPSWMCSCLSAVGKSWLEILISRSTPSKERSMPWTYWTTHTSSTWHRYWKFHNQRGGHLQRSCSR